MKKLGGRAALAWIMAAATLVAACSAFGTDAGATCPGPTLDPAVPPAASTAASVTYGFLIDRAYTGDAKRSPSYPWPQLPRTALDTVAGALPKLDLRPGDSVFAAWISHNSNDIREIFLPVAQVPRSTALDLPAAPARPKPPVNKLECNQYAEQVRSYNEQAKTWRTTVGDLQQRARDADARTVATFVDRQQAALRAAAPAQDPVGTDIYGGLAVAGGVFKSNPGRHKLVLFSDMSDTIGNAVRPDLAQSDVVIALYHRDDPNDQGVAQKQWETALRTLGARATVFLPWAATTVDKIADQLKESGR